MVAGSFPPGEVSADTPISRSGFSTRSMGREDSEGIACETCSDLMAADETHHQARPGARVPKVEIARRRGKPLAPTPLIVQAPCPVRTTPAPSALTAFAVLSTSSPSRRPVMVDSPSATAAIMTARCEQDLSPGARTEPAIRTTGLEARTHGASSALWTGLPDPIWPGAT